jgi:protein O-GlcNAc transferase
LASLRLTPVQCTTWMHPQTSGLPTIDYFLSSDLMEPDADNYYVEKLLRLPNLALYYTPKDIPPLPIERKTFGLRDEAIIFLYCQSRFKYLAQHGHSPYDGDNRNHSPYRIALAVRLAQDP